MSAPGNTSNEYIEFVKSFIEKPSLFYPTNENGEPASFTQEAIDIILDLTSSLYDLCKRCEDRWNWLGDALNQHYSSLQNISIEGLSREKIEEVQADIFSAQTELSRVHQNIDFVFGQEIRRSKDKCLLDAVSHFWDDCEHSLVVEKAIQFAAKKVDEIERNIRAKREEIRDKTHISQYERLNGLISSSKDQIEDLIQKNQEFKNLVEKVNKHSDQVEDILDKIKNTNTDMEGVKAKADQTYSEMKTRLDGVLPNVLSILGIFVAIIVAFIGGFFVVKEADTNISSIAQVSMAYFLLMGQVLINIFFLLMFMLARLSGNSINAICRYYASVKVAEKEIHHCYNCKRECKWYVKVWNKYPYVVIANWGICVGYIILLLWWYWDIFIHPLVLLKLTENIAFNLGVFVAICFIGLFLCIGIPWIVYSKERKNQSNAKIDESVTQRQEQEISGEEK